MTKHSVTVDIDGDRVIVRYEAPHRPWTTNSERSGNRYKRAADTKNWRGLYAAWTLEAGPPKLTEAHVYVDLYLKGPLQDTAACNPAVKAAIDGMVDGGLFLDDTGDHVTAITFRAPQRAKENQTIITVEGNLLVRPSTLS